MHPAQNFECISKQNSILLLTDSSSSHQQGYKSYSKYVLTDTARGGTRALKGYMAQINSILHVFNN